METYRRRLPHIHPPGKWLFVTCHLHGSIPQGIYPPKGLPAGRAFVWIDRFLDTAQSGPMHLRMESVARVVFDALHRGEELGYYELGPFVIKIGRAHV